MAYSNWGAFVYKNGERRTDKEDVGVFDTDEKKIPSGMRIFANIIKNQNNNNDDWYNHSHHAVLGDDIVRLCGYKCEPELYIVENNKIKSISLPESYEENQQEKGEVIVDNKEWIWEFRKFNGNMIDLKLIEPDRTEWTSRCGYCYGAGHDEI